MKNKATIKYLTNISLCKKNIKELDNNLLKVLVHGPTMHTMF